MKKIVMLIISLFGMFPLVAKQKTDLLKEHAGVSWCMHRAMHAFAKTITENPIFSIIGGYYLFFDHKAVENNTFWSAVFGACLLATFVKNLISPDTHPKNFIAKTIVENPFFSFVAAHMLWFHRNKITRYPLETMIVGGVLLFDLAANYEAEYNNGDSEELETQLV